MIKKVRALLGILLVVFIGIVVHLGGLATETALQDVGVGQASRRITVATMRGTIYDTELEPLVNQTPGFVASVLPDASHLAVVQKAMHRLDYLKLLEQLESGSPCIAKLTGPIPFTDGMCQFLVRERYGDTLPASHLLGYLDAGGQQGVTGVEKAFNHILSQYTGMASVSYAVNGSGGYLKGAEPVVENTLDRAKGGIALTVHRDIQRIVEESSAGLVKGAVVVLEPRSGEVLAGVSYPNYHPDSVADSIQKDDGSLINRMLARYDCGSVFKIVTAAAALENGVEVNRSYTCEGSMLVGETTFHCHHRLGHQQLTMEQAFAYSCNLYFVQLARDIGAATLLETADRLGLSTPIELAEGMRADSSILPTLEELSVPAALGNFSFGQGKLLISPLHIAAMTSVVTSGGILTCPTLYKGEVTVEGVLLETPSGGGERVISEMTAKRLRKMMEQVVSVGTGKKAALQGVSSAGKTGTAETGQKNGDTPVVQSWFTGYFPADNPQYVITVLAEDCENTGVNASEVFCEISNNLIEWEREQMN